jgi:hypothetical protein
MKTTAEILAEIDRRIEIFPIGDIGRELHDLRGWIESNLPVKPDSCDHEYWDRWDANGQECHKCGATK